MNSTSAAVRRRAPATHRITWFALVALALSLLGVGVVNAQEPLTVEKFVVQVNEQAPPESEVTSVQSGDTVDFGINVSSDADLAALDVTLTDVFDANLLEFAGTSSGGCTEAAGQVTCTVTLDDSGSTELTLTFTVLFVAECQRLLNTVEVIGEPDLVAAGEAEIEACPADDGDAASADDGDAAPTATASEGTMSSGGNPDTAIGSDRPSTSAVLIVLGLLLVGAGCFRAVATGLHRSRR